MKLMTFFEDEFSSEDETENKKTSTEIKPDKKKRRKNNYLLNTVAIIVYLIQLVISYIYLVEYNLIDAQHNPVIK